MSLVDYRDAVMVAIKAAMPNLREVEAHAGRFTLDDLKQFATRAPGIRVAILALENPENTSSGEIDWMVRAAAFVVTKNEPGLKREAGALNIVGALAVLIAGNRFAQAGAHPAKPPRAQTMMSTALGKTGATIWAVEWTQKLRLGEDAYLIDGLVPTDLYIGFAPKIGADHVDDYLHVGPGL